MNPEGQVESDEDSPGMPEEQDDEDDCSKPSDVFRARTESLDDK